MKDAILLFRSAVTIMTPLIFAAAGGLYSTLAGKLNIALEGLLLTGAFSALAAFCFTGSFTAALAAAVLASLALSILLAFTTLVLRSNVFICGLAVNILSGGLCVVLADKLFNTKGVIAPEISLRLPQADIPLIKDIPLIGSLFSGYSWFVYAGLFLLFLSWLIIYKTPFGYRLRACENCDAALDSLGIKPDLYRFAAFLVTGFFCGIGGAYLSLNLGAFVPGMSAGKGWIALVVIFLGGRRPLGLLAAAFLLGLAEAFSNYAQGLWKIPADFILALPYFCALFAMVAVSIRTKWKSDFL